MFVVLQQIDTKERVSENGDWRLPTHSDEYFVVIGTDFSGIYSLFYFKEYDISETLHNCNHNTNQTKF